MFKVADVMKEIQRDNLSRVGQAVLDTCSKMYRAALTSFVSPKDLPDIVRNTQHHRLTKAELKSVLAADANGYDNFDISLMYKLFRNICTNMKNSDVRDLDLPARGSDKIPNPIQTNLADDIERIRSIKNTTLSHVPTGFLVEKEYRRIWDTLKEIAARMEERFGGEYRKDLAKLETYTLGETQWKELVQNLQECLERGRSS